MSKINSAIIVDVETGGLSYKKNPVCQIAYQVVQLDDYKQILEFSTYIQPYDDDLIYDEKAMEHTGIKFQDLQSGMDLKSVVKKMNEDFAAANTSNNFRTKPILVGHNIGFDIGFICDMFRRAKVDITKVLNCNHDIPSSIDTMLLAKQKWASEDIKYNLEVCVAKAGLALHDAHDAMNDVRATRDLFLYFTNNIRSGEATSEASDNIRVRNHFRF